MKKIKYIILTSFLIFISCALTVFAGNEVNTNVIDAGGYKLLSIIQSIGFWAIVIKGIYEVVKCALNYDKKAVGDTVISYVIIAVALYGMPSIITMIKNFFG